MTNKYYELQPFYLVKWKENEKTNSLKIDIRLVHPDGIGRGIALHVTPECMFSITEDAELVQRIINKHDVGIGAQVRNDLFGRALEVIRNIEGCPEEKTKIANSVLGGKVGLLNYWEKQLGISYD